MGIICQIAQYLQSYSAITGLIGVIVGSVSTLLVVWLNSREERKQELFRREIERVIKLEEFVGEVTEWVGGFQLKHDDPELEVRMKKLAILAGQFRRYPELKQVLRDLHNRAGILIEERKEHGDFREAKKELEEKYKEFIKVIDRVTGKRET